MKEKEVTKVKLKEKWLQNELEEFNRQVDGLHAMFQTLTKKMHENRETGREIWAKIEELYKLDGEKYRFSYDHRTKEINCLLKYGKDIARQFPKKK